MGEFRISDAPVGLSATSDMPAHSGCNMLNRHATFQDMISTKRQLVEDRLGSDLEAFVLDLRQDGVSWTVISRRIERVVGVQVSGNTLRLWFEESTG